MEIAVLVGAALVMLVAAVIGFKAMKALVKLLLFGAALALLAIAYLVYTQFW